MDDAKRRAAIRLRAVKNKEADVDPMGTGSSKPSTKRRPPAKEDRAPKRPKVSLELVIGLMAEGTKTATPSKHGAGKGLMIPPPGNQKKPPILLSSIINSEDYEDLGNHSTEAMEETGLFSIAQVNIRRFLSDVFSPVYILCSELTPLFFRPCS